MRMAFLLSQIQTYTYLGVSEARKETPFPGKDTVWSPCVTLATYDLTLTDCCPNHFRKHLRISFTKKRAWRKGS